MELSGRNKLCTALNTNYLFLGLGAGIDSFYEILLKSFIMYGRKEDRDMFEEAYTSIKQYMRRYTCAEACLRRKHQSVHAQVYNLHAHRRV